MKPDEAIQQLKNLAKGSKQAMRNAEFEINNRIALTAISLAPEDSTKLVNSIDIEQEAYSSTVVVNAPYAPYVEFGTGDFAEAYVAGLPEEWKEEARKSFVNGQGHGKAQPFFYPAVQRHLPELQEVLDIELNKLIE